MPVHQQRREATFAACTTCHSSLARRVYNAFQDRTRKLSPLEHFAHAFEDLPDDARHHAVGVWGGKQHISLRRRIQEELETIALDSYGNLERLPLLSFLSRYPVTPYTYQVSGLVSRGQRPDVQKLTDLADGGQYRATINLCAEMPDGDDPAISRAGLDGVLWTWHIPITDMETPTISQVTEILSLLSGPDAALTYLHCEAGRGRTGVAIACYRMAVMGWSVADALSEAVNFGCCIPRQQAFIRECGAMLLAGSFPGPYPLLPLGSVGVSPEQLAATIHTVADGAVRT
jgi:Tyrosine phosphatase family